MRGGLKPNCHFPSLNEHHLARVKTVSHAAVAVSDGQYREMGWEISGLVPRVGPYSANQNSPVTSVGLEAKGAGHRVTQPSIKVIENFSPDGSFAFITNMYPSGEELAESVF